MHRGGVSLMLAAVLCSRAAGQGERLIELDPGAAAARMEAMRGAWGDGAAWSLRAAGLRSLLVGRLGLPTLRADGRNGESASARGLFDPIASAPRRFDGYEVVNLAVRSFDGSRVTGNLYLPTGRGGPFPAVLCPHGHFGATGDDAEGRFRRDMQLRCATLARMGAVVFAYDMVGWGESDIAEHHDTAALALQCYNSVRALDYLCSREDVDPSRVAITGASGGGTQTFLLAALDERVAVSVPCVQVSAHFFGGCECETGLPIHTYGDVVTNNAEIAAMAAPRPMLVISDGDDWTSNTPRVEFPYILGVYAELGAADLVGNAHFGDEGHDYGPSKRAAMYRFLARRLGLDPDGADESVVTIEPRGALLVYGDSPPPDRPGAAALEALRGSLAPPAAASPDQ